MTIAVLWFRLFLHVKLEKQHICVLTESAAPLRCSLNRDRERERERERCALWERPRAHAVVSFRCIIFCFATSRIHKKHIRHGHGTLGGPWLLGARGSRLPLPWVSLPLHCTKYYLEHIFFFSPNVRTILDLFYSIFLNLLSTEQCLNCQEVDSKTQQTILEYNYKAHFRFPLALSCRPQFEKHKAPNE